MKLSCVLSRGGVPQGVMVFTYEGNEGVAAYVRLAKASMLSSAVTGVSVFFSRLQQQR